MLLTVAKYLEILGLTWLVPPLKMAAGQDPRYEARRLLRMVGLPLLSISLFLGGWHALSQVVAIGQQRLPGPGEVYAQAQAIVGEYRAERRLYAAYLVEVDKARAENPEMTHAEISQFVSYAAEPNYLHRIMTSLKTVFAGFMVAVLIAVPLGILCGMSSAVFEMVNPFIQVLKPVSPLAWLPIVYIIVGAVVPNDGFLPKSFVTAAVVVALCSLWPTLINTANGVANVEKDHLNVAKVLNLGWFAKVTKVVLPSALPHIFNGMRLSIGVGWMVLIAAEMLSQNPGLGLFIWNMYQSSSDNTLALIMVAVLTIGLIGFVLDRIMVALQRLVSPGALVAVR